jgi:protein-disulfide isomerase
MSDRRTTTPKAERPTTRKGAARERAASMREAQARSERRRRALTQAGIGAAVLALVVGVGVAVQVQRDTVAGPDGAPANTVDGGFGFATGPSAAKATVTVFEDFQCPACKVFESVAGPSLKKLTSNGDARVVYRPIAFLDNASTTRYSTRSLNAAACAADAGAFGRMHETLFANQPAENTAGLTDDRLIELGRQAGVSGDTFSNCVKDKRYLRWTKDATDASSKAGVSGTPTVLVNGKQVKGAQGLPTGADIEAAVQAAKG